jgi:signal transduction histidine kinase
VRHSLRIRALVLVFLFNSAVFGTLGIVLARAQSEAARENDEQRTQELAATIADTIAPLGLRVASILRWPSWGFFEDAILVDADVNELSDGLVRTSGIDLNPVGLARRPADFPRNEALRAALTAMRTGEPVPFLAGRAVPIRTQRGVWGGLWYRSRPSVDYGSVLGRVLPWFALSTLVLTTVTFLALRQLVLMPVEQLAEGARRLRAGDFSVRLAEPARRDELAELVRSFNEMASTVAGFNQRLSDEVKKAEDKARAAEAAAMRERRLAAVGELAAGIAHEINNPLGGLQNAVEDLKKPELPPARRGQYLELLARGLARIGETVHRLRRFTPREAPFEEVELAAVLHDALELVAHRARSLGVELVAPAGAGGFLVRGLRNDLGHALLNLLVNALDALEDHGTRDRAGPRITLTLERAGASVVLRVRDNGQGVDPALLDRIVDLFFTTKEVGRGTGLGLALVHATMQAHGGELLLASEPGRSFTAELRFPPRSEGGSA